LSPEKVDDAVEDVILEDAFKIGAITQIGVHKTKVFTSQYFYTATTLELLGGTDYPL
jgi:hypothetical protein